MSDDSSPTPETPRAQGMPPVRLVGQYIKDLSFEVPSAPQIFTAMNEQAPELSLSVQVKVQHGGENAYEVVLQFNIATTVAGQTAFIIDLSYGCVVVLDETVIPQDQIHPLLHIEIPRLVFPFPRQIIADLCSNSGFPPLMLQIIDFAELYAKRFGMPVQNPDAAQPAPTIN